MNAVETWPCDVCGLHSGNADGRRHPVCAKAMDALDDAWQWMDAAQDRVDLWEARWERGEYNAAAELARAELQLANAEAAVVEARRGIAQARQAVAQ